MASLFKVIIHMNEWTEAMTAALKSWENDHQAGKEHPSGQNRSDYLWDRFKVEALNYIHGASHESPPTIRPDQVTAWEYWLQHENLVKYFEPNSRNNETPGSNRPWRLVSPNHEFISFVIAARELPNTPVRFARPRSLPSIVAAAGAGKGGKGGKGRGKGDGKGGAGRAKSPRR